MVASFSHLIGYLCNNVITHSAPVTNQSEITLYVKVALFYKYNVETKVTAYNYLYKIGLNLCAGWFLNVQIMSQLYLETARSL